MAKLSIATKDEFLNALYAIPFARGRLTGPPHTNYPLSDYALWHELLRLVNDAIAVSDWTVVNSLLKIYDAVGRAGKRSEMFEASYVAFLEDIHLPNEPTALREFWRHASPLFASDLKRDRGLD